MADKETQNKFISSPKGGVEGVYPLLVFNPRGRLGNAIFRYMACAVLNILNPTLKYTLKRNVMAEDDLNGFTYYPGQDHNGDDLYCVKEQTGRLEKADADHSVMGFNTLGYFKHTIDVNKLISNQYINKDNRHGLYVKKTLMITDDNFFYYLYKKKNGFNLVMDGYFQFDVIYNVYKTEILAYMEQHKNEHYIQTDNNQRFCFSELLQDMKLSPEQQYDIIIHLRLDDFNGRPDFIELQYYLDLFAGIDFTEKTVCILCQTVSDKKDTLYLEQMLEWFKKHSISVKVESNSLLMDFNMMKQAKVLVCSMSTLAWSAAYLSNKLQQCYMPDYNFYHVPERRMSFFKKPIENTILYPVKTTSPILSRIKPYILTLPEYSERLTKLTDFRQKLSNIGLTCNIYNGVNGKDVVLKNTSIKTLKTITWQNQSYYYDTTKRLNGMPMSPGEFGCIWSHLNLLRQLLAEPNPAIYYLILEDDVELVKPLEMLEDLLHHIPTDTDMCHLAKSDSHTFIPINKVNKYFYKCTKRFFNKTTAYLISQKGAQKVLDYANININMPIDDLYNVIFRTQFDFMFYVPDTFFFKEQLNISSCIKDIDNALP